MSEEMFPRSVVMAVGSEGFRRGWTEAVDACIAAVEALPANGIGLDAEGKLSESAIGHELIAALREVQP